MTIAQVFAILGLLLAFDVPQPKIDEIQAILMQKVPVSQQLVIQTPKIGGTIKVMDKTISTFVDLTNAPMNGCARAVVYVFVKQGDKELEGESVSFNGETQKTYLVGRVVPDGTGSQEGHYLHMHTGAQFIYDPKPFEGTQTLKFTSGDLTNEIPLICKLTV